MLHLVDSDKEVFVVDPASGYGINAEYVLLLIRLYQLSEDAFLSLMDLAREFVEEFDVQRPAKA